MQTNRNIVYTTDALESFYKNNRIEWDDFYPSERHIFEIIGFSQDSHVLDIGCGCGGLGNALKAKFGVRNYTGVDINEQAIVTGRKAYPHFTLLSGDILSGATLGLRSNSFDVVISLSCIDWNIEFDNMLLAAMEYVKPGGIFISSFRLTKEPSVASISDSFQHVNFESNFIGEKAPYIVLNYRDLMKKLHAFSPKRIQSYGYMGKPSSTAVTPYDEVCFSVFAITKGPSDACEVLADLPECIIS